MATDSYSVKGKTVGLYEMSDFDATLDGTEAYEQLAVSAIQPTTDPVADESDDQVGVRHKIAQQVKISTDLEMPAVSLTGKVKTLQLPYFAYAYFQNCAELGTGVNKKTFTLPKSQPLQPDFSLDQGFFCAIANRSPLAGAGELIYPMIAKSFVFSIEKPGYATFTTEMVGNGPALKSVTFSGSWTPKANDFYHYSRISTSLINLGSGDVSLPLKSMTLTLNQDVEGVGFDGAGKYGSLYVGNQLMDFTIRMSHGARTVAAKTARDAETIITVKVGWGNTTPGTVDKDLYWQFTGKIKSVKDDNEGFLGDEISGEILASDVSSDPISLIIADSVLRGW